MRLYSSYPSNVSSSPHFGEMQSNAGFSLTNLWSKSLPLLPQKHHSADFNKVLSTVMTWGPLLGMGIMALATHRGAGAEQKRVENVVAEHLRANGSNPPESTSLPQLQRPTLAQQVRDREVWEQQETLPDDSHSTTEKVTSSLPNPQKQRKRFEDALLIPRQVRHDIGYPAFVKNVHEANDLETLRRVWETYKRQWEAQQLAYDAQPDDSIKDDYQHALTLVGQDMHSLHHVYSNLLKDAHEYRGKITSASSPVPPNKLHVSRMGIGVHSGWPGDDEILFSEEDYYKEAQAKAQTRCNELNKQLKSAYQDWLKRSVETTEEELHDIQRTIRRELGYEKMLESFKAAKTAEELDTHKALFDGRKAAYDAGYNDSPTGKVFNTHVQDVTAYYNLYSYYLTDGKAKQVAYDAKLAAHKLTTDVPKPLLLSSPKLKLYTQDAADETLAFSGGEYHKARQESARLNAEFKKAIESQYEQKRRDVEAAKKAEEVQQKQEETQQAREAARVKTDNDRTLAEQLELDDSVYTDLNYDQSLKDLQAAKDKGTIDQVERKFNMTFEAKQKAYNAILGEYKQKRQPALDRATHDFGEWLKLQRHYLDLKARAEQETNNLDLTMNPLESGELASSIKPLILKSFSTQSYTFKGAGEDVKSSDHIHTLQSKLNTLQGTVDTAYNARRQEAHSKNVAEWETELSKILTTLQSGPSDIRTEEERYKSVTDKIKTELKEVSQLAAEIVKGKPAEYDALLTRYLECKLALESLKEKNRLTPKHFDSSKGQPLVLSEARNLDGIALRQEVKDRICSSFNVEILQNDVCQHYQTAAKPFLDAKETEWKKQLNNHQPAAKSKLTRKPKGNAWDAFSAEVLNTLEPFTSIKAARYGGTTSDGYEAMDALKVKAEQILRDCNIDITKQFAKAVADEKAKSKAPPNLSKLYDKTPSKIERKALEPLIKTDFDEYATQLKARLVTSFNDPAGTNYKAAKLQKDLKALKPSTSGSSPTTAAAATTQAGRKQARVIKEEIRTLRNQIQAEYKEILDLDPLKYPEFQQQAIHDLRQEILVKGFDPTTPSSGAASGSTSTPTPAPISYLETMRTLRDLEVNARLANKMRKVDEAKNLDQLPKKSPLSIAPASGIVDKFSNKLDITKSQEAFSYYLDNHLPLSPNQKQEEASSLNRYLQTHEDAYQTKKSELTRESEEVRDRLLKAYDEKLKNVRILSSSERKSRCDALKLELEILTGNITPVAAASGGKATDIQQADLDILSSSDKKQLAAKLLLLTKAKAPVQRVWGYVPSSLQGAAKLLTPGS